MKQYRQGDVFLQPAVSLPSHCKPLERKVVAWGEKTGHHHRFDCDDAAVQLLEAPDGALWIQVRQLIPLVHEEHKTLHVEPGIYRYVPQREYRPGPVQNWAYVVD